MDQRTLLGRLLSPAGFGLVLIFFSLPFATVSCGDGTEHVQATFTGLDMAIGSLPAVTSPDSDPASAEQIAQIVVEGSDLEPLALLAALSVLAGLVVSTLRRRRIRHGAAVALAVAAAALLAAAMARTAGHVAEFLSKLAGAEGVPAEVTTSTTTRFGFWLTLVALAGLAVGNGVVLLRTPRSPTDSRQSETYSSESISDQATKSKIDEAGHGAGAGHGES